MMVPNVYHPSSRGAGDSCSRGVCLIQRLNGRGYTASSHVASAFVTSSESVLLIEGRPGTNGLTHLRLPGHQRRGQRQGGAKAPGAQVSGTHAGQRWAPFPSSPGPPWVAFDSASDALCTVGVFKPVCGGRK